MDQSVLTLQQDVSNLALGLGVQGKFLDALKLRKIYDVRTKQPTTMPLGFSPLASAGQPAVVSNQGNNMTYSSHAVGKAGVEIIDGLGMDCDQDKIIQDLITTVQPQKLPCHIDDFSNQSIDIDVWEPRMESSFLSARITIMVQTQTRTNDLHWTGPLMTPDMLQQHHTRMVAV